MHFIPLIYFASLTYYFWQRNHVFDIAVYMTLLFTITSFCCVIMVEGGYMEGSGVLCDGYAPDISIFATITYCAFVTMTIAPFALIRPEKIKRIENAHRIVLYVLTGIITLQGFLMAYVVMGSISGLLDGDFNYIKEAGYAGDMSPFEVKLATMHVAIKIFLLPASLTLFALPLFFYFTCIEKRSLWLTSPLLLVSVGPVLRGMVSADRTEIIYYGLMFFFCLILFQKHLEKRVKYFFGILSVPVMIIGTVYIVAVSISRFEEREEGASGSMLEYAGQPFLNYCYFYENHNSDLYYIEREIPITSWIVFNSQYADTKTERTAREGFFVGVFASHVGSWLLDVGVIGAFVLSFLFALISLIVIGRFNREVYDISDVLMLFCLVTIPIFGIFYYRYYSAPLAIQYLVAGLLYLFAKVSIVWHKDKTEV